MDVHPVSGNPMEPYDAHPVLGPRDEHRERVPSDAERAMSDDETDSHPGIHLLWNTSDSEGNETAVLSRHTSGTEHQEPEYLRGLLHEARLPRDGPGRILIHQRASAEARNAFRYYRSDGLREGTYRTRMLDGVSDRDDPLSHSDTSISSIEQTPPDHDAGSDSGLWNDGHGQIIHLRSGSEQWGQARRSWHAALLHHAHPDNNFGDTMDRWVREGGRRDNRRFRRQHLLSHPTEDVGPVREPDAD